MERKNKMSRLLVPHEVCKILRISKSSFYKKVWQGQIPVIKLGRSIRVDKKQLMDFLEKNSRKV